MATSVENKGESATTIIPQKKIKPINNQAGAKSRTTGEIKQQIPEKINAQVAVHLVPNFSEIKPPTKQAIPPKPIVINDKCEMGKYDAIDPDT